MYQSPHNPDYIIPDLYKYSCECGKEFILSDAYDNSKAVCPYCKSKNIEAVAAMVDPDKLDELGCMGISVNNSDTFF